MNRSTSRNSSSEARLKGKCFLCVARKFAEAVKDEEVFVYFAHHYNINKALRIIRKTSHELYDVEVSKLAGFVDYPPEPMIDILNTLKAAISEEHIDHVNDDPIILAHVPKDPKDKTKPRPVFPIDGHHRIAKAIKNGVETLKCYVLNEAETDKILTDVLKRKR